MIYPSMIGQIFKVCLVVIRRDPNQRTQKEVTHIHRDAHVVGDLERVECLRFSGTFTPCQQRSSQRSSVRRHVGAKHLR